MISGKTIERIWKCQREISAGEQLLKEMKQISENIKRGENPERIKDAFGRERDLQLGIPCSESSRTLLNVSPSLAVSIITVHIANKKAELVEANEQAKIELQDAPQNNAEGVVVQQATAKGMQAEEPPATV